jgi:hypothetical protein
MVDITKLPHYVTHCGSSVPVAPNGRLVPDLTDLDPTFEQAAPRGLEVRDDEIDVAKRTDGGVGESVTDLDGAAGARRSELNDSESFVRRIVYVEHEADLIDIEPQRSPDIAHRQRDHFD